MTESDQWDGAEKRRTGPLTLRELEDHIDARITLRLAEHATEEAKRIDGKFDEIKMLLKSAFPGGDPDEHRRYHDEVISWMRERRDLWKAVREKTLTALFWSLLVGLGTAVWAAVRSGLGR